VADSTATAAGTYERLARLPLVVEGLRRERLEVEVSSDFRRVTTVVRLAGGGHEGVGEDVTYAPEEHDDSVHVAVERGWETFDAYSEHVGSLELFRVPPAFAVYGKYRRWAYESAALDLALRQADLSLAEALGFEPAPLSFVVSLRLGEPPDVDFVRGWLALYPALRFKLDPTSSWDEAVVSELAATGAVDVVDLKGAYRGTAVDQPADARLYRLVAEGFPHAWIEDPDLGDPECRAVLDLHRERITWDAPIHSVEDIRALSFPPRTLNVKPSRFGSVRALLETYDYCAAAGISLYGGGQFELGPGRGQIQHFASLVSPDAPNDVAPAEYNAGSARRGLPAPPLAPPAEQRGFGWG
jgi:hypothetical protein